SSRRAFERQIEDDEYCVSYREALTGVEREHRHGLAYGQSPTNLVDLMGQAPVERVDPDGEGQVGPFEVVDRRVAVAQARAVPHDERPERALGQVVPHEPEPGLAGRAEQVQLQ